MHDTQDTKLLSQLPSSSGEPTNGGRGQGEGRSRGCDRSKHDSNILIGLGVLSLCMMALILSQQWHWVSVGANDFVPFYCGAKLLDSGQLYDYEAISTEQLRQTGRFEKTFGYIRPPFHAAFLWPLTRLPFLTAYWCFQIASLAALMGFMVLWRPPPAAQTFLFVSMSLAALTVFVRGQDVFFVLLIVAAAVRLRRNNMPFAAGLLFSLCAVKPHFFVLTPLVLIAQREWRFIRGVLAGGGMLGLLSFAVGGANWIEQFLASATNPMFSPNVSQMPNLHGGLYYISSALGVELLLSATVAVAVWIVGRRSDFDYAFPFSLAGGVLVSHHAYMLDLVILLPAILTVLHRTKLKVLKALGVGLLTPAAHLVVELGGPSAAFVTGGLLVFVYLGAYERVWQTNERSVEALQATPKPAAG